MIPSYVGLLGVVSQAAVHLLCQQRAQDKKYFVEKLQLPGAFMT